jgi:hypothetical protein
LAHRTDKTPAFRDAFRGVWPAIASLANSAADLCAYVTNATHLVGNTRTLDTGPHSAKSLWIASRTKSASASGKTPP